MKKKISIKERRKLLKKRTKAWNKAKVILVEMFFWFIRIVAVVWLVKYLWNMYKPPKELNPNDWDLPVVVEEVKEQ